ncbi:MAG: response regulator [Anaerolineae bacterium]|nr:response regulator [Anaerolineae bacterium]
MQNLSILVVEDDADGQAVMATLLEHMKVNVDIAADAAEAEKFLFQSGKTYNAAIIDLALPDKNGWEILAEIQTHSQTANLPCIAVTAYHTSKLREDAITAGFTAYFAKPVDGTKFLRELDSMLN